MSAPLDSVENSYTSDRRSCRRQKVLFSSVVINETDCRRLLDISPKGLALETDTVVVNDEFSNLRFKLSPLMAWVEVRGRVAWRNSALNVVGIEFIGVTEAVQKEIETWIELKKELLELSKPTEPVTDAHHSANLGDRSEITAAGPSVASDLADSVAEKRGEAPIFPQVHHPTEADPSIRRSTQKLSSDLVDLHSKNENQPPPPPPVQYPTEATDARTVGESRGVKTIAGVPFTEGAKLKLVVLALIAAALLSVVFVRGIPRRKSANIQTEQTRTPAAPPSQPVQPATSGESPAVPPSQPAAPVSSPAVLTPNLKPTLQGPSYVLQVAAMIHETNANALANSLRRMNFPAFVLKVPTGRFHHVFVGPYNSKDAANEAKKDLEKRGFQVMRKEWTGKAP